MSGLVGSFVVNDVGVKAFVEANSTGGTPNSFQLRVVRTAVDYRAMRGQARRLWAGTVARAELLPEPALHQRFDDEWSFVETLCRLILPTELTRHAFAGTDFALI